MFFLLLNMSTLDEFSESQQLMDIGICLMIEGGWLEKVSIWIGESGLVWLMAYQPL